MTQLIGRAAWHRHFPGVLLILTTVLCAAAQHGASNGEWRFYGGDAGTTKYSPLDQIKGSLAGCDSYLTKPVHNSVFQQVVRKYLGRIAGQEIKVQTGTG